MTKVYLFRYIFLLSLDSDYNIHITVYVSVSSDCDYSKHVRIFVVSSLVKDFSIHVGVHSSEFPR